MSCARRNGGVGAGRGVDRDRKMQGKKGDGKKLARSGITLLDAEKKLYRRESYQFMKSWTPGVYEGAMNARGLPDGHGVLTEGTVDVVCTTCNDGPIAGRCYTRVQHGQKLVLCPGCFDQLSTTELKAAFRVADEPGSGASLRREYNGEWKNGLPCGLGVLSFEDGKRHEGYWDQGKPNAFGIETRPDGAIIQTNADGTKISQRPDGNVHARNMHPTWRAHARVCVDTYMIVV